MESTNDIQRRAKKTFSQVIPAYISFELLFVLLEAVLPQLEDWLEQGGGWTALQVLLPTLGTAAFASGFSYLQNKYRERKGVEL